MRGLAASLPADGTGGLSQTRSEPHRPKGEYAGFRSMTVCANWRVIFRFEDGHAADADHLDCQ